MRRSNMNALGLLSIPEGTVLAVFLCLYAYNLVTSKRSF